MLRVTAIGYRPVRDDVIRALQQSGALEIEQSPYEGLEAATLDTDDPRVRAAAEDLAEMQFTRDFLGRFHRNEQPLSTFVAEKFHLAQSEYFELARDARHKELYRETVSLADTLAHNERERQRLAQLASELERWESLRLPISEWQHTDHTILLAGVVPASEGREIRDRLRDEVTNVTVEELGPQGPYQAWMIIAHMDSIDAVRTVLASSHFSEVRFDGLSGDPAQERTRALEQIEQLKAESDELNARARQLSDAEYHHMFALVQALESQRERIHVLEDVGQSDSAFFITGWVPERRVQSLQSALAPLGDDVDVTLREPEADEEPPVMLENQSLLRPFEILTDLYGRPRYRDADPTPLLAPFFLLFFAICIGDFGYGAMLIAGALLIKTRLDVAPGVKKFMDLLVLGGAGAMVIGVLLGGYFALPVDRLPRFLQSLQVLDPIEDVQAFLLIALSLGVVQVFFGVILAAVHAFKRGDAESAFNDHVSILVMFGLIAAMVLTGQMVLLVAGLVFTMAAQGRAITAAFGSREAPVWDRAVGWAWLASAVWFVVSFGIGGTVTALGVFLGLSVVGPFFSLTVRRAVLGMLGGAYSVYGMTGFAGDVLSYMRLTALGLSSTLVGWVFNILAGLVWGAAVPLWTTGGLSIAWAALVAIGAIAIFTVGHVFNVVINLLGAFVHPARLQFVEFFSKFYEAGGRPYQPFAYRSENLVLGASGAEKEGGSS